LAVDTKFAKPQDIANMLDVHLFTVQRWLAAGKIRGIKAGRVWRIAPEEVERIRREGVIEEVEG